MTTKKDLLRDDVIQSVNRIFPDVAEWKEVAILINYFVDSIENEQEDFDEEIEENEEELLPIDRI